MPDKMKVAASKDGAASDYRVLAVERFDRLSTQARVHARTVCELYGGIGLTTLWRRIRDGSIPKPLPYNGKRPGGKREWVVGDLREALARKA